MTCRILLYSKVGNTLKVGEELAWELGAQLHEIEVPDCEDGFRARLRQRISALLSKEPQVYTSDQPWGKSDLLILGTPACAGRAALPLRQWLATRPALPDRVALLITSEEASCPSSVVEDLTRLIGRNPVAVMYASTTELPTGAWKSRLSQFLDLCVVRYRQSA
ncbi:hypothetical protein DL237_08450 [Pseudooceanicola sediminis]|uniref:Flavodoxin family protein n=1 Tax=Pseudooceanicola sediminis TaxID=2211117 RepID=A0A399J1R7_9RHOB|nr:hypothetical protein [Pseudooceanicola sediminis]KAA2316261.1 hypothetical protein E0K93_05305 [Puniceibacterium sp. HSS470]RII39171.1 hypothetical protein DL237_08450 [Pseudooceanicola sediminis]|tara:strand:- start:72375 stop:72866 length:492 start_codon:yes stop_codon:yes gene_type:complete